MTRTGLKTWFVDRCVSWWADVEPPRWLRTATKKDASFRDARDQLHELVSQLKSDSKAWAASQATEASMDFLRDTDADSRLNPSAVTHAPSDHWRKTRYVAAASVVSAAIVGLIVWNSSRDQRIAESTVVVNEPQQIGDEVQSLATALRNSLEGTRASIADVSSTVNVEVLPRRSIGDAIQGPVRAFSRSYGQTVNFVARHVENSAH